MSADAADKAALRPFTAPVGLEAFEGLRREHGSAWPMPPTGFLGTFVAWCPRCEAFRLRQHRAGACCWRGEV